MQLYFLRHGLAEDREQWTEDDTKRPLTAKGKKRTDREAKRIADLDLGLDAIITSPLVRARQTAEIVAARLNMEDRLQQDQRLSPGFGLDALAELVRAMPDANALMLVGHEPDLSETIGNLIGGGRVICKKGGLARVDIESADSLHGELVWLLPPSLLAA